MYGFRGNAHNADLLSPFEMCRYWLPVASKPPGTRASDGIMHSDFTPEGRAYRKACEKECLKKEYEAGVHFVTLSILLHFHPLRECSGHATENTLLLSTFVSLTRLGLDGICRFYH